MTPTEDWLNLDNLTDNQAKMLLRMAVTNFRIIAESIKFPLDESQYTPQGHAQAAGCSKGFIVQWEEVWEKSLPQEG